MSPFISNTNSFKKLLNTIFIILIITSCTGQENQKAKYPQRSEPISTNPSNRTAFFPQRHANLNGMVTQFVRKMYQDSHGNIWFGTNGDGIIRYDGKSLADLTHNYGTGMSIRGIIEDEKGNIWFGTSSGLIRYNDLNDTIYSTQEGLNNPEIWSIAIDNKQTIWVGTVDGLNTFDGEKFTPFDIPKANVDNPQSMLSENRIADILMDSRGHIWFSIDGYGISKYNGHSFTFFTTDNGLPDNSVADLFEDSQGNIWIGTFFGGVSMYDGHSFSNFTKNGAIEGIETYNFCEDQQGNVWFSAENFGVYRYDGSSFTSFTKEDGLATNTIQHIFEDNKGQIWFCTWEGMSLYTDTTFVDASEKEPWAK